MGAVVACLSDGSWSVQAQCVPVGAQLAVGVAGTIYMVMTEDGEFSLAWAVAFVQYFKDAAAMLLGVDSDYVGVEISSLERRVRTRLLQQSEIEVRVTLFGSEQDASAIESQMVCAFFNCVNGSDSVSFNDMSDGFSIALMSVLVAAGQAVPSGLSTAQARFSDFSFVDNFTYAVPESSESSSVSEVDNSAAIGIAVGASLGGCCCVCVVLIVAFVSKRRALKASN